jgi:hypothetical protein
MVQHNKSENEIDKRIESLSTIRDFVTEIFNN